MCDSGTKICIGNVAATCAADGLSFALNPCGGPCQDGQCIAQECFHPGHNRCEGNAVKKCNDTGTASSTKECKDGQQCAAGQCNEIPCSPGEVVCGWRELATCNAAGDGWEKTSCASDEICTAGACTAQICAPGEITCVDLGHQELCNADGTGGSKTSCGSGKACYAGFGCQSCLCGNQECDPNAPPDTTDPDAISQSETADTTIEPDTKPVVELEPLDEAEAVIDGQKIEFSSYQTAYYMSDESDLRIIMDAGLQKIEISLKGLEEFDVGQWTDAQGGDVQVSIMYNDGSPLPEGAQWKYVTNQYDVELLKFQAPGGRVKGTFSGTFTPDGGTTNIPFTDGYFDIKRDN